MKIELLGKLLTAAAQEGTVRTYHCTSLASRLLGLRAEGFLTVTNKRVIFFASGSSYGGKSVLTSEVPVADISGISTYKGTYFSIGHFLTAIVVSFVAGNVASVLLSAVVGLIISSALRNTYNFSVAQAALVAVGLLGVVALLASGAFQRDRIWRPILASLGAFLLAGPTAIGMVLESLSRLSGGGGGLSAFLATAALAAGIYALVTMFWYARREGMSLTIGSKGGATTPIAISGISVFGIFNTAALRALAAEPAEDAATMIRELGALISDIQTSGDIAARNWVMRDASQNQPDAGERERS